MHLMLSSFPFVVGGVAGLKQALISLSDKRDVDYLAKGLVDLGYYSSFFCFWFL
jgi:hypothetical protein